jgi:hypothetical protein
MRGLFDPVDIPDGILREASTAERASVTWSGTAASKLQV